MAIPPKVKINLRMTEDLRDRVELMADREQVSANTLMVRALENYLQWKERSQPAHWVAQKPVAVVAEASLSEDRVPPPAGGVYAACPCGSGKKWKFCHGGKVV